MEHTHPLLVPRIEVMFSHPHSPLKKGEVLVKIGANYLLDASMEYGITAEEVHAHPHLFRKMAWYEKRLIREMPEYLKSWDKPVNHQSTFSNVVIKAGVDFFWNNSEFQIDKDGFVEAYGGIYIHVFTPATLSDYTDYINSKKK